jgi:cysteine desulfurase NifS
MMGKEETREGPCGICPAGCWIKARVHDGRLLEVEPLSGHPLGMICTIGRHSPQIVHDPRRLQTPLRRTGAKGRGEFTPIGWDEALDLIAGRLKAVRDDYGPQACAIYTGRGSFDMALCDLFQPADVAVSSASNILFPFGSPNTLGVGALCYVSFAMIAPHVTMGEMLITMDTDIEQAELVVIWGANPATDSPPLAHEQILQARERGAQVVSIDPRRTETARLAGAEWIPIRPGTDGALALGMIQVLLEEELYDDEFARDWTVGFAELQAMVQHYRPEIVEGITGVPAVTVRSLARRIASARGACPVTYTGLEYSDSGVQAIRAVFTLWALAGQLDVPGGLLFRMKENVFPQNRSGLIANPDVRQALGRDRFPIYSMYRGESHAIALPDAVLKGEPYRVRALIILGGSILTAWPDPSLWRATFEGLDFLACIDRYPTADSAFADIVLPAATQYETTSYMRYGPMFKIREKIIEPVGEARSDFMILAELAKRLGYGELYPQTEDDLLRHALAESGFSLEEVRRAGGAVQIPTVPMEYRKWRKGRLRPDGRPGFNTPTGKFEIASTVLAEHGYDPLPVYTEPTEGPLRSPSLAGRYPYIFTSGTRTRFKFRSQHHGIPSLSAFHPEPTAALNVRDAAELDIRNGDRIWVETPRGRALFRADVTEDIARGTVDADMGGGGPLGPDAWRHCNVNELTDPTHYDPISGFPIYKTLLCRVVLADRTTKVVPSPRFTDAQPVHPLQGSPERLVYLDHNATTPVDPEVVEAMLTLLRQEWGNPSSLHSPGRHARAALEGARRRIAQALNCTARRLVFTSGGSEAANLAIRGVLWERREGSRHLITSTIEHPAVLACCRDLEEEGWEITRLTVNDEGLVDPAALLEALRHETALVTIMFANNETGVIQPIAELARIARSAGVLFHTDAVQAFGKIPIDVEELGIDLLSVSAHKLHGPKGVGALYVRQGVPLHPVITGGGQEQGRRAGTENVPGIVGFGKACELAQRRLNEGETARVRALRDRLEEGILALVPEARRNGHPVLRLPNTTSLILPGIRGESLVLALDHFGICLSPGSACKSGDPEPSHALLAMGLSAEEAHCSVRFSLGAGNSVEDIDYVLEGLERTVKKARETVRFVACR